MYYLDRDALTRKLEFLHGIGEHLVLVAPGNKGNEVGELLSVLARERLLHLAMETVTDIGNMLIDCFMMRDAGSYEDILQILHEEQVMAKSSRDVLLQLVRLKPTLLKELEKRLTVQSWSELEDWQTQLVRTLPVFIDEVERFVIKEII